MPLKYKSTSIVRGQRTFWIHVCDLSGNLTISNELKKIMAPAEFYKMTYYKSRDDTTRAATLLVVSFFLFIWPHEIGHESVPSKWLFNEHFMGILILVIGVSDVLGHESNSILKWFDYRQKNGSKALNSSFVYCN